MVGLNDILSSKNMTSPNNTFNTIKDKKSLCKKIESMEKFNQVSKQKELSKQVFIGPNKNLTILKTRTLTPEPSFFKTFTRVKDKPVEEFSFKPMISAKSRNLAEKSNARRELRKLEKQEKVHKSSSQHIDKKRSDIFFYKNLKWLNNIKDEQELNRIANHINVHTKN